MAQKAQSDEIVVPGYLKVSKVISWLFYFWVMIGIVFMTMRVFLLATSANMNAGFSNFVWQVSQDYMQPFRGIFPTKSLGETGYLDVSAIFAIIVYLFLAWGFKALIDYVQGKIDMNKAEQQAAIRKAEAQKAAQARASQSRNSQASQRTTTTTTRTTTSK